MKLKSVFVCLVAITCLAVIGCGSKDDDGGAKIDVTKPLPIQGHPKEGKPTVGAAGAGSTGGSQAATQPMGK